MCNCIKKQSGSKKITISKQFRNMENWEMQQWSVQCLVKMHEFWNTEDKEEGKEEEEEA